MSETTTAVLIAGGAVVVFLFYQSSQQQAAQQAAIQNAILLKLATPAPAPSSNPFNALASLAGPLLSLI